MDFFKLTSREVNTIESFSLHKDQTCCAVLGRFRAALFWLQIAHKELAVVLLRAFSIVAIPPTIVQFN